MQKTQQILKEKERERQVKEFLSLYGCMKGKVTPISDEEFRKLRYEAGEEFLKKFEKGIIRD